jgi:hypothetical protein
MRCDPRVGCLSPGAIRDLEEWSPRCVRLKHLDANRDAGHAADRIRLTDSPADFIANVLFSAASCPISARVFDFRTKFQDATHALLMLGHERRVVLFHGFDGYR